MLQLYVECRMHSLANVGDHITAGEIKLPPSATLLTHAEEIVVSITAFVEEKEEITPAPETVIIGEESVPEPDLSVVRGRRDDHPTRPPGRAMGATPAPSSFWRSGR